MQKEYILKSSHLAIIVLIVSWQPSCFGMANILNRLESAAFFKKEPSQITDADIQEIRRDLDIIKGRDSRAPRIERIFQAKMKQVSSELQVKWLPEKRVEALIKEIEKAVQQEQQMLQYNQILISFIEQDPELHRQLEFLNSQIGLNNSFRTVVTQVPPILYDMSPPERNIVPLQQELEKVRQQSQQKLEYSKILMGLIEQNPDLCRQFDIINAQME